MPLQRIQQRVGRQLSGTTDWRPLWRLGQSVGWVMGMLSLWGGFVQAWVCSGCMTAMKAELGYKAQVETAWESAMGLAPR